MLVAVFARGRMSPVRLFYSATLHLVSIKISHCGSAAVESVAATAVGALCVREACKRHTDTELSPSEHRELLPEYLERNRSESY